MILTNQFFNFFFPKLIIFEFYYLFILLKKFFHLFYNNNIFKIKTIIFYFFKIKYDLKTPFLEKFKKLTKYDYFSINFKLKNENVNLMNNFKLNPIIPDNCVFKNNNKNGFFFKKLINLFFIFNYFVSDIDFKFHYVYKYLFVNFYYKNVVINNNKFITK
jgi:hypothetical protein